ncbi:MAG: GTP-binding protein [Planctomycetes bacterium]|nr:GTP-binding protein [Planctomycetota bacterium]
MQSVCQCGARAAEPGEFTLRAFLAGRLDLTQAEAVLGVINARGQEDLDTALAQLAGGLSGPLLKLREQLLQILAELEAGLDFADEDIEFISQENLGRILGEARQTVLAALEQMGNRTETTDLPRVVFLGPPNVGKSSLFNALVDSCGSTTRSIVSSRSGTTRDYVTAVVDLDGMVCELIDTAGQDDSVAAESIAHAAQSMSNEQRDQATLRVQCLPASEVRSIDRLEPSQLVAFTKSDLAETDLVANDSTVACSSLTGAGIDAVRAQIRQRLEQVAQREGNSVAITAARCAESLHHANASLERAIGLCEQSGVEELVAAEVRIALLDLGRVVGAVYTEDVLDRIFSQFCIGK